MVGVNLTDASKRTTVVGIREPKADAQTIRPTRNYCSSPEQAGRRNRRRPDACARGGEIDSWFSKQARASLGSSKSLVDIGGEGQAVLPFLSHLNQIGQTGATPRHAKGLSTCCHGESRTRSAGGSSASAAPSASIRTAAGRAARRTCCMLPMRSL